MELFQTKKKKSPPVNLLTEKNISNFPMICIDLASNMTAVITMPLSMKYFQTALHGPLVAEGALPFMHSKCQDLSCHCSWLCDCIFEQRACALWSFRTLKRSRFSSMGYYYLALP